MVVVRCSADVDVSTVPTRVFTGSYDSSERAKRVLKSVGMGIPSIRVVFPRVVGRRNEE
jgi:hypothetical protein